MSQIRLPVRHVTPKADAPCYGCTDRAVGCHSVCTRYIGWRKGWDSKLADLRSREDEEFLLNKNKRRRR